MFFVSWSCSSFRVQLEHSHSVKMMYARPRHPIWTYRQALAFIFYRKRPSNQLYGCPASLNVTRCHESWPHLRSLLIFAGRNCEPQHSARIWRRFLSCLFKLPLLMCSTRRKGKQSIKDAKRNNYDGEMRLLIEVRPYPKKFERITLNYIWCWKRSSIDWHSSLVLVACREDAQKSLSQAELYLL
jgi:hypothetical protein